MKKNLTLLLLTLFFHSCAPKISSSIISNQNRLSDNDYVLVIEEDDYFNNDGIQIGTLKSGDKGLSVNCNYDDIISSFKKICRLNGANILNIIEHKLPNQWSSCHQVEAIMFKVPDYKIYEKQIEWSKDRKLTWNDFKNKSLNDKNSSFAGAESNIDFGFKSNTVRIFNNAKIDVFNKFNCKLSWVIPQNKNNEKLLEHEQLHFDLTEVYARQLRKKISEKKLTIFNFRKESAIIYQDIYRLYKERQDLYDTETKHGLNNEQQKKWKDTIENELIELESFSNN